MMKRLFIASQIRLNKAFVNELSLMKNVLKDDMISWSQTQNMHLTLKFLGNTAESQIPAIVSAMEKAFKDVDSSIINWNKLGIFGSSYSPRVLWLGTDDNSLANMLFLRLKTELETIGIDYDSQNFVPHITLARIKKVRDKRLVFNLLNRKIFPQMTQCQIVDKISLVESILDGRSCKYDYLHDVFLKK